MSKLKKSTIQCNDFDCETIQSAIYKIHFSSTGQNFGLQIRFGCAGRQSPSLLGQSGQKWTIADSDSITILSRTKQSFLILSSCFSPVQAPGAGWRSVTSQLLREVCPRPLSSILSPRDRYLDVTPRWSPEIGHISLGAAPPPSQTHEQGVIVINRATNCKWLL